jgi:hypothetical protein
MMPAMFWCLCRTALMTPSSAIAHDSSPETVAVVPKL